MDNTTKNMAGEKEYPLIFLVLYNRIIFPLIFSLAL